jgi:hypothetical protein
MPSKNGVPASFLFFVNLYRIRSLWLDKKMADLTITHTIKYNSLKKEYAVSRSWDSNSPVVLQSFDAAKKLMTEIDSLKVIPLGSLEKGRQYQIQAKAKLSRVTLPYYLHYVLFFSPSGILKPTGIPSILSINRFSQMPS